MNGLRRKAGLEAAEKAVVQPMNAALREAHRHVAETIAKASGDKRLLTSPAFRRKTFSAVGLHYKVLEKELAALMHRGGLKVSELFRAEAISDIRAARKGTAKTIVKFDRRRAQVTMEMIAPETASQLVASVTDRMSRMQVDRLRKVFVDVWRTADLEGLTLRDRASLMQDGWSKVAGESASGVLTDAAGRVWNPSAYSTMLVRTTQARVARDSYFDVLTANGDDLAIIENVDGDACEICTEWDGKVISITGSSTEHPSYQDAMDEGWGHPNCRCTAERYDELSSHPGR
jgi:hypothetical protein